MRITMIGSGYVGLVSGACLSDFGHDVCCVDKDQAKIDALNDGRMPIYEPGLDQLVAANVQAGRLTFTTDLAAAKKKGVNLGSVELTDVERNEYPAALSKSGSSSETAKKFNEWLKNSDEAKKILTEYGFNTAQ